MSDDMKVTVTAECDRCDWTASTGVNLAREKVADVEGEMADRLRQHVREMHSDSNSDALS